MRRGVRRYQSVADQCSVTSMEPTKSTTASAEISALYLIADFRSRLRSVRRLSEHHRNTAKCHSDANDLCRYHSRMSAHFRDELLPGSKVALQIRRGSARARSCRKLPRLTSIDRALVQAQSEPRPN